MGDGKRKKELGDSGGVGWKMESKGRRGGPSALLFSRPSLPGALGRQWTSGPAATRSRAAPVGTQPRPQARPQHPSTPGPTVKATVASADRRQHIAAAFFTPSPAHASAAPLPPLTALRLRMREPARRRAPA
ncbi:hypothetical protein P154DRAFT_532106 [Amniculicola lignicola CBS 123094]|uniref:Uncharacterized protein n=1 Tax=Amniculicola lignicola CBS 123094 TaxID=1392246 RepID=A0A6A5WS16_9PLEO|nr:hypothetical protein P154DRAFT_532106 [Amniculicola lignicola CBS 123094]